MVPKERKRQSMPPAYWFGLGAIAMTAISLTVDWRVSVLPVSVYIAICLIAPFFPRWGFFVPVISRGHSGQSSVALTFDDGPDPLATPALLRMLRQYDIRATFFVSGSKVGIHPRIIESILKSGHTIGNHSYDHDPRILFRSHQAILRDICATQKALEACGVQPLVYRPPIGILSPRLRGPLQQAGLQVVNFSCRAFDRGNRKIEGLAGRILASVRADDIILLHDIMPLGEQHMDAWLKELSNLLEGLAARGLTVAPLEDLIHMPVMTTLGPATGSS